jgi:hypothetical protein
MRHHRRVMAEREVKVYSGKKVVVIAILGAVLFTVGMLIGTKGFADWLTPILKSRSEKAASQN